MTDVQKAIETQLRNIQARTGKSLAELADIVQQSGLSRHGEIRDMLKRELGLGHGDANMLALHVRKADEPAAAGEAGTADVLDTIYEGARAPLRPIHERLIEEIQRFGPFESAPKKGYVSLRRKKQFAMVGPATNTRVEVGLNMKGVDGTARLLAQPPGGMCQYKVRLAHAGEVDDELIDWIRQAYDSAG